MKDNYHKPKVPYGINFYHLMSYIQRLILQLLRVASVRQEQEIQTREELKKIVQEQGDVRSKYAKAKHVILNQRIFR